MARPQKHTDRQHGGERGKQATAPAQGTAPPGSAPPPTQQRTGDAPASTAPAGDSSGQTGNSASGATSTGSTKTGATKRVSFFSATGKTSDADMREADGNASADAATQETEDVRGLIFAGMLRQEEVDVPDFVLPERPSHWKLPTPPDLKTNAYLVGVPGIVNDIRAGAFAMEGYGSASTLIGFEELSDEDLQGLKEVCGSNAGIDVLCPRRSPLSAFELDNTLNSIGIRREMASLLRHFNSTRLAERVFKMTGYLRRVLGAYRNIRSLADSQQGFTATQEVVDTRRKYNELKRAWKFTCDYWFLEVQEALGKVDDAESKYKVALDEQKTRYQDEIDSLESEKTQLKARLADSEAQVRILKSRLESPTVDPWKFSDFLQEHTSFTGNWECLHDLFKLCIKNSKPPESWDTVVNITAMDKRKAAVAPYPEKSTCMPPSSGSGSSGRPEILDLTGPGSKPRSGPKTGGETQDSNKSQGSKKVQRRPKDHQPGRDSVRRAGEKTVVSKEAAHSMLPGGVVWKEVRPDVRQAILTGLRYDSAMEWIGSDRVAHGHFRQPQLIKMLVGMMYWRRLDKTPWSKYVPEAYYEMADERLDRCLRRGDVPPPWGNLDDHMVYPDEDCGRHRERPDNQAPAQGPEESASSGSSEEEEGKVAPETLEDIEDAEDDDDAEDDNEVEEPLEVKPPAKRPRSESSKKPQGSDSKSKKKRRTGNKKDTSFWCELVAAEDPEDNETSWRIYGVLVQYPSSTKSASCQTPGFPEYEIHKYSYDVVHERWDREAYQERELLSAKALKLMEDVVDVMHKHAQAIWERRHWVPIPTDEQADATMESQRKSRRNALRRVYKTLVERSRNTPGFIPSLWHEPGLWKFPDKCCYWIWEDPRAKKLGGAKCKDLDVKLATLDIREPARVQWNTAADGDKWLQYVPNDTKRHIKPLAIRRLNPLSLKHS
ncbi:hypothetical protein PHYSODRAFT_258254 [Phytophthora sojae]|uniref:Uncharacterized protein n=1 Tax=Phytophthora sojae (strain P6497) TaxID=1094619 RepID=G4YPE8_PHYSP|nr:hypothetical protein PHYSODRAFT_258254 [Phytophthora sojae]EGZ27928.1 hypothetical protein PHYSODRAFT_258254 [Phytophthora sojae]|eukprot:XP_009515203.1 hypothetical protein PHYSODRAFT_258254 [Phytophthora sojae]